MAPPLSGFNPYHVWLGVAPELASPNFYQLLNVPEFEPSDQVIENGFNRQMVFLKTIKGGEYADVAERLKAELEQARGELLDHTKKDDYDRRLRQVLAEQTQAAEVERISQFRARLEARVAEERVRFDAELQSLDAEIAAAENARNEMAVELVSATPLPGDGVAWLPPTRTLVKHSLWFAVPLAAALVGFVFCLIVAAATRRVPQVQYGTVQIEFSQSPQDLRFQLDGRSIEAKELNGARQLTVGRHHFLVTGSRIEPVAKSFEIRAGEESKLPVSWVVRPLVGRLQVVLDNPPGALELRLDGRSLNAQELQSPLSLLAGNHYLLATAPGMEPLLEAFALNADVETDLRIRWDRSGNSPLTSASVSLQSRKPPTVVATNTPAKPAAIQTPRTVAPFIEDQAKKQQQACASYLGQPVEKEIKLPGGATLLMILIPPGEFVREEDGKRFPVRLTKPFYLGKYEVTQAQWQSVMGNNPSGFRGPSHPVERVSWNDIQPFLAKLNEASLDDKLTFTLPTEAQWEYACRAGTTTTYSFGDSDADFPQYGWFQDNAGATTHPVGQLKPNPFGLYDMHGNVWEWCAEWMAHGHYASAPIDDPQGPSQGSARVIRGGSWGLVQQRCRTSNRGGYDPADQGNYLGFRVAQIPSR